MTKDTKSTVPSEEEDKKQKVKRKKLQNEEKKKKKKWVPISGIEHCTFGIALAYELFMNT